MRIAIMYGMYEVTYGIIAELLMAIKRAANSRNHVVQEYEMRTTKFRKVLAFSPDCIVFFMPWSVHRYGYHNADELGNINILKIFVQTEPSTRSDFFSCTIPWVKNVDAVFDIAGSSLDVTQSLAKKNAVVKKILIGYDPAFVFTADPIAEPIKYEYDVGLVGQMTLRRAKVLQAIENEGFLIWTTNKEREYSEQRNRKIEKTKIMLEISHSDDCLYGPIRVEALFISNNKFVISEPVPLNGPCSIRQNIDFIACPYDEMVNVTLEWLKQKQSNRDAVANTANNHLRSQSYFGDRFITEIEKIL